MDTMTSLKGETGRDARRRIRAGGHRQPTSGMAPGYVQGNLAILPKELAADFTRFCMLNPKPCPLLGQSEPGDQRLPTLGEDLDIRTDIPLLPRLEERRAGRGGRPTSRRCGATISCRSCSAAPSPSRRR